MPGRKHHIVVDAQGIPLAPKVTGANRHDSRVSEATLDARAGVAGREGARTSCMRTRAAMKSTAVLYLKRRRLQTRLAPPTLAAAVIGSRFVEDLC